MNERLLDICIKANIKTWSFNEVGFISLYESELEKFAVLVEAAARADEREECAKLAETTVCDIHLPTGTKIYGSRVAAAIRARGTT